MTWREPERIGSAVERELARFGAVGTMAEIVAIWPDAVGEAIARNAWPARIARDGTLHVATSSSAWALELTQLAPTMLERLAERLGELAPARLRFAPGPLPAHGAENVPTPSRSVPEPSREHLAEASRIAAQIDDSVLRELVARAAAASLAAAGAGPTDRGV